MTLKSSIKFREFLKAVVLSDNKILYCGSSLIFCVSSSELNNFYLILHRCNTRNVNIKSWMPPDVKSRKENVLKISKQLSTNSFWLAKRRRILLKFNWNSHKCEPEEEEVVENNFWISSINRLLHFFNKILYYLFSKNSLVWWHCNFN